jgi:hypothetical protein
VPIPGVTMKKLIYALIPPILAAVIAGVVLAQPQASASNAQEFFKGYFSRVTQSSQRQELYWQDLTKDYRQIPNNSFSNYNSWWASVDRVEVNNVQSTSGNKLSFTVWLTYYMQDGKTLGPEAITYVLVCNGLLASVADRMPNGCPVSRLQIESGLEGTPPTP